jgi:hypothetical protein
VRATGGGRISLVGDHRPAGPARSTVGPIPIPIPNYAARARSRYEAMRVPKR